MDNYHNMEKQEIFKKLNTSENGLNEKKINYRINKYGLNTLPKKKEDSILKIFVRQYLDPILILLSITVIFSFLINETINAFAIIFIILLDLLLGTVQEWKANKNASSLLKMIKVKVNVLRNGKEVLVDSEKLVVGDIVLLESGDKISADMRIIECQNFTTNESALTGESVNESKISEVIDKDIILSDRVNMVYAGTIVITGRAKCVVVSTGVNTEIGKIAHKVANTKDTKSPLTIRMEKFSKQISVLVVVVAIIITILLFMKNTPGEEIFLSVIALSVSAMPEGLPLALTMALTIASNRMFKKSVIVKKLNAVESLGSCTLIASDKTGTLTVNEQTAKKIILPKGNELEITGTGYNDVGEIIGEVNEEVENLILCGSINNEAKLEKINNKWQSDGDSIDIAFLALGLKAKINTKKVKILGQIPYESENKYSATFYELNNKVYCTVKGSPEKIMGFTEKKSNKIQKQYESLASEGYRVLAIANGEVKNFKKKEKYDEKEINKLKFSGLVGFIDPIRKEVNKAIDDAKTAGVKVVMITGDHPLTALAISKELNLTSDINEVVTGEDIQKALEKGQNYFDNYIKDKIVFSRVTPLMKLEIVESYKRNGEYVAVTGDGVNDAPALKAANIGVSMGSGTDVAKETASMIITDDSFTSIVEGIKEGRSAYSNIRKVCYMLLSCGLAEVLFFVLAVAFDLPMPLVAIQLLWLNIVTDGLQDFALSFEKNDDSIMKEPPKNPKETIFNKKLLTEVLISGGTIGLLVFILWFYLINILNMDTYIARGYIMVLMVFLQNMHVFNCRSENKSAFSVPIKTNPLIIFTILSSIILQIIVMEVPVLSKFLQTTTIPVNHIFMLFMLSLIVLLVMELYKIITYRGKNE